MNPRAPGSRGAFTLVEVMVALAILSVAILTMIVIRNNSVSEAHSAKEVTLVTRLAQAKMGQLDVEPIDERGDGGTFENHEEIRWQKEVSLEVLEASGANSSNQKPMELYKVTLTITYPKGAAVETYVIVTYRLKKEDEEPKTDTSKTGTSTSGSGSGAATSGSGASKSGSGAAKTGGS